MLREPLMLFQRENRILRRLRTYGKEEYLKCCRFVFVLFKIFFLVWKREAVTNSFFWRKM